MAGCRMVSICFDIADALADIGEDSMGRFGGLAGVAAADLVRFAAGPESRMRDSQHGGQMDRDTDGVSALARSVVARLTGRPLRRTAEPELVAALVRAALDGGVDGLAALRADLRRARVGDVDLVDVYLPQAARELGCQWVDDEASFSEVSIGVARMQALLHRIGRGWAERTEPVAGQPSVLLLLPEGEQHTFGAMVVLAQLRRRGASVRFRMGGTVAEIGAAVLQQDYDAALISVACEEKLDLCRRLVKALRKGSGGDMRIVVGGAVLDRPVDALQATGADLATNDLEQALAGLGTSPAQRRLR